jgi:hypothetical protein
MHSVLTGPLVLEATMRPGLSSHTSVHHKCDSQLRHTLLVGTHAAILLQAPQGTSCSKFSDRKHSVLLFLPSCLPAGPSMLLASTPFSSHQIDCTHKVLSTGAGSATASWCNSASDTLFSSSPRCHSQVLGHTACWASWQCAALCKLSPSLPHSSTTLDIVAATYNSVLFCTVLWDCWPNPCTSPAQSVPSSGAAAGAAASGEGHGMDAPLQQLLLRGRPQRLPRLLTPLFRRHPLAP